MAHDLKYNPLRMSSFFEEVRSSASRDINTRRIAVRIVGESSIEGREGYGMKKPVKDSIPCVAGLGDGQTVFRIAPRLQ